MDKVFNSSLLVEQVIRDESRPLAIRVTPPRDVDLQFIYRAAMHIYWDPTSSCLVDRFEGEASLLSRFERVVRALKSEYGMSLRASGDIILKGVSDSERAAIQDLLWKPMSDADRPACRCCAANTPIDGRRVCPECGHVFRGNGWDGIDAHWRSKHEEVMAYEVFWASLCDLHRARKR